MNNDAFYATLSSETLREFALKTFGDPPSDLEEISKYISNGDRVLEVGCGTGRIGLPLIQRHNIEYTGVDSNAAYLEMFQKLAGQQPRVELIKQPIQKISKQTFDKILFPWTVIADFTELEQKAVLQQAYSLLDERGLCILDNPSQNQKPNQYGIYQPTLFYYQHWKERLGHMGFMSESSTYITRTGVERELTFLAKSDSLP